MLYGRFFNWTVSTLGDIHQWLWNIMGGLWSWTTSLLANFLILDTLLQGLILAAWLGFGAWITWKAKVRSLPDKVILTTTWPALIWSIAPLCVLVYGYAAWLVIGFYAFFGVGLIAMFEIPIRWMGSLF